MKELEPGLLMNKDAAIVFLNRSYELIDESQASLMLTIDSDGVRTYYVRDTNQPTQGEAK